MSLIERCIWERVICIEARVRQMRKRGSRTRVPRARKNKHNPASDNGRVHRRFAPYRDGHGHNQYYESSYSTCGCFTVGMYSLGKPDVRHRQSHRDCAARRVDCHYRYHARLPEPRGCFENGVHSAGKFGLLFRKQHTHRRCMMYDGHF